MSPSLVLITAPAAPVTGHTYALPVVRELPRPVPSGAGEW